MTKQSAQPSGAREARELFSAHLEVLVHLIRDDLRWGDQDQGELRAPIFSLLRRERRRLLDFQGGELEREARFRLARDRRVTVLEEKLGLAAGDALAVSWHFDAELRTRRSAVVEPVSTGQPDLQNLLSSVGFAHGRLLEGEGSFVPGPDPHTSRGLSMAVAVAATRLAGSRGYRATWIEVEPRALEILRTLINHTPGSGGPGTLSASPASPDPMRMHSERAS